MNKIRSFYYLFFSPLNYLKLWFFGVKYYKLTINGSLFIVSRGTMIIGENAKINSDKYISPLGGDTRCSIIVKRGASLVIGKNLKMSNSAIYCAESIRVGDDVMIGGSCRIWDTDFHPVDPAMRRESPNDNYKTAPVSIGNNAFIGGLSIILKGVTIGDNSVVAAGSVVTKSIPPNEIWGGNPAVFIKKL